MAVLDKAQLRHVLKKKRQCLKEDEYLSLSLFCYQTLKEWPVFQSAQVIGFYASIHHEVNTMFMIKDCLAMGKTILLPKVLGDHEMVFYEVHDLSCLRAGRFGIPEPDTGCIPSDQMDLLIVPLLGYNDHGDRLGMGGGFYDRYLAEHPQLLTCGLAFSFQKCQFFPDHYDIPLKYLINEKERLMFDMISPK